MNYIKSLFHNNNKTNSGISFIKEDTRNIVGRLFSRKDKTVDDILSTPIEDMIIKKVEVFEEDDKSDMEVAFSSPKINIMEEESFEENNAADIYETDIDINFSASRIMAVKRMKEKGYTSDKIASKLKCTTKAVDFILANYK